MPLAYLHHKLIWCNRITSIHRVIILLERPYLHNRIGRNWCNFSRPECATLMALVGGGGRGLRDKYVFCVPRELQRLLSLFCLCLCGRSSTAGKILFTWRQTCSLYLVLWLCASICKNNIFSVVSKFFVPVTS